MGFGTKSAWSGDSAIPSAAPAERYAGMSRHSPFALATPAAPTAPAGPSFAANWFVTGIARIDDQDFVSIQARDLSTQFSLLGHEPHPGNEVSLVEVQWSPVIGKSTVTLRKGTEIARLEFNEAAVHGPAPAATPGGIAAKKAGTGGIAPSGVSIAGSASVPRAQPPGATPGVSNIHRRVVTLSVSP